MSARRKFTALYELNHGIQVTAEYSHGRYVMCKILPHPLFTATVSNGTMYVRRSRVVMTAKLGRILLPSEHVHHKNHSRHDDDPGNLELLNPADHNREHKLGSRHSEESKRLIGDSLRKAIQEGRRLPPKPKDQRGESNPVAKLTWPQVAEIRASDMKHSDLAAQYGVSRRNIGMIKRGETW